MWLEQEGLKPGYKINDEGYIEMQVQFRGDVPPGVIFEPIPPNIKFPRWVNGEWKEDENNK